MMNRLGYGAWDELKAEIRNHWRFRFDWFIKSRTPQVGGCLAGRGGCAGVADEGEVMRHVLHRRRRVPRPPHLTHLDSPRSRPPACRSCRGAARR